MGNRGGVLRSIWVTPKGPRYTLFSLWLVSSFTSFTLLIEVVLNVCYFQSLS